jgi:hypothetical protein
VVGVGELKMKLGVEGKVVGVGLKSANGKSRGTAGEGFGSVEVDIIGGGWVKVDVCVCGVVGPVEEEACAEVELVVNGLGDGIGVVPLMAGAAVSLELLTCCSLKRRRAAFEVASRVLVGSRGGSAVVESVDSDSVRESELVSEAEEVESAVVLAVDCCGASAEAFHSAG